MRIREFVAVAVAFTLGAGWLSAQTPLPQLPPVEAFSMQAQTALHISRETDSGRPFSVIGPHGALLGQQDGSFEGWIFPWKVFSHMQITANMQDYAVPIDVNQHAAWIDVRPNATVLTYSHANFTIRQIMFTPKQIEQGAGAVVLYQIEAVRPMTLTFSFTPVMQRMWPALSDDVPSPEWVKTGTASGFYELHQNFPGNAAALAMPTAEPGILPPYQERAQAWPLQFVLHFDPARDRGKLYPLLFLIGLTPQSATKEALARSLATLDEAAPSLFASTAAYYANLLSSHTSLSTPDAHLNDAFSWAITAIDQLKVETPGENGEALTAGFVGSGDSARPGFGWFFGRDALWTLYAVNGYGDFGTTRHEIEFLLRHQRADGKIMHEYSQTANLVDWQALPYEYAAADSTPLLLMAANDCMNISGDEDFVRSHWEGLQRAWEFETTHDSADGIYNNTQGTGWVESWIPGMPYQEIYLASLDEQASTAFAHLARAAGHADVAEQAEARAGKLRETIEKEYFLPGRDFYAFSHNANGTTDDTPTIYPSVAWWDGSFGLTHSDAMMRRWASSEFSTDWGTRDVGDRVSFYDPISYHQGSVWPLFTGWASVAEYRAGHPLAGYTHLMQNADLTWAQDLGSVTELLSGEFYQTLGRSTAHQLWSSAMVISPILRGMFGLEWNAATKSLEITPHLPATWNAATVRRIPLGDTTVDVTMTRRGEELVVEGTGGVHLSSEAPGAKLAGALLHIPLPAVEAAIDEHLPDFGAETKQMKVLDEQRSGRSLTLTLAGQGGSEEKLTLRVNGARLQVHASGATPGTPMDGLEPVTVQFPAGAGYVTKTVTFTW